MFSLQEPRLRVAAEGPQTLLQLERLPVSEMQTDRWTTAGHGRPGNVNVTLAVLDGMRVQLVSLFYVYLFIQRALYIPLSCALISLFNLLNVSCL